MRGRFAPSPTGAMHLGNARTALLAWLACRAAEGTMVLRLEDLDAARASAAASEGLLDDLRFLGLDWDEGPDRGGPHGPYCQSERTPLYQAAVERLLASHDAFFCACSRADVARASSAPHGEGGDGPRYPGTCRSRAAGDVIVQAARLGRRPTVRFRGQDRALPTSFVDGLHGEVDPLPAGLDDFVLCKADGVAAYQLAVVVDDIAMQVSDVVRGDDLLSSTPRQLALFAALGAAPPRFHHVPLVLAPGRERLAKRTRPPSIADLRSRGVTAEVIVGALAASAGLVPAGVALPASALVSGFELAQISRHPVELDATSLG